MWLTPNTLNQIDRNSGIIGRAILICQKFEATCNDIITWFEATIALENRKYEFMSTEYISYVDDLHRMLLGQSINKLSNHKKEIIVSKSEIQILNEARKSRNWIVHESGLKTLFTNKDLEVEELSMHVKKVARGEFLVSNWSYQFHEQETLRFINESLYTNCIVDWVVCPDEDKTRQTLWFFR